MRKASFSRASLLGLLLAGCIECPHALVPMAAATPSPTQVASCEQTRNWHNAWIVLGTTFGGLSSAGGTAGAATTNQNDKLGFSIGAAISGVLASISTVAAGITADTYATDNCTTVLEQAFTEKQ